MRPVEELRSAAFTVTSSHPGITLTPFINIPNEQIVGAMGKIKQLYR